MKSRRMQVDQGGQAWMFTWMAALLLIFICKIQADENVPAASQESPIAQANSGRPEVWLCAGDRLADLLEPDAEWPFGKQQLTGIKFYIGQLYGDRGQATEVTVQRLRRFVRLVRAHDLQVAVELGGCLEFSPLDDTAGEWSARRELRAIENFYAAGGTIDFLDLDGPIRRLMHPKNRRDERCFDSIEAAADELVDALQIHRQAHPEICYWLLTNFPNWGWRGDVSYHARGPHRQDNGDYDQVVRIVLDKLKTAGIALDGVTVDNPYEYLIGEFHSVKNRDPKSVDWLGRVRSYEDFAKENGLTFNLIVNSQRGGRESDELFFRETLQMTDAYLHAGGKPTRWFVQSWYPFPKQIVPESAPHSMMALVKAVTQRVRPEGTGQTRVKSTVRRSAPAVQPRVISGISYGMEEPEAQKLTAYLVPSSEPTPVIVQINSGGWNSAPPRGTNAGPFQAYLEAGMSVVVVAHRPIGQSVHWPVPADDVARAIQFLRANSMRLGIDPRRIALKGRSSGGHIALMVGLGPDRKKPESDDRVERESSRPTCIVAGSAPTDLVLQMSELLKDSPRREYLQERMRALAGIEQDDLTVDELTQRLKPLSPIEYVSPNSPPIMLTHPGPADAYWPGDERLKWDVHTPITGLILAKKLQELGVPHELVMLPESQDRRGNAGIAKELAFIQKYLNRKSLLKTVPKDQP